MGAAAPRNETDERRHVPLPYGSIGAAPLALPQQTPIAWDSYLITTPRVLRVFFSDASEVKRSQVCRY